MKGVLATAAPQVPVDDISHGVSHGDIRGGAYALRRYWNRYPPGTVHIAVVDPGVGTPRRPLAVQADGRYLVLPDNGLASRVLVEASQWEAVRLDPDRIGTEAASATFHGRDLFAPAGARLVTGTPLADLGGPVEDPVRWDEPAPRRRGACVEGDVVSVDRFGNLITNVPAELLPGSAVVSVAGSRLPLLRTYGGTGPGELLALVNSDGRLEVAVREGSAMEVLGVGEGAVVRVEEGGEPPGS